MTNSFKARTACVDAEPKSPGAEFVISRSPRFESSLLWSGPVDVAGGHTDRLDLSHPSETRSSPYAAVSRSRLRPGLTHFAHCYTMRGPYPDEQNHTSLPAFSDRLPLTTEM